MDDNLGNIKHGVALHMKEARQALDAAKMNLLSEQYGDHVISVLIFGSKARGDARADSDIDVLAVLDNDDPRLRSQVRRTAARVSLEYDVLISIRAVSHSHWEEMSEYEYPLYKTIKAEGIRLDHRLE